MEKKYTLAEIRLYLQRSDSLGDALYYLNKIDEIISIEEEEVWEESVSEITDLKYRYNNKGFCEEIV